MGELVYTGLNEPGYPEVVAVNTGVGLLTKVGCVGSKATVIIRRYLRNAGNFSLTKFYQIKKRSPFNSPSQSTPVPPSELLATV